MSAGSTNPSGACEHLSALADGELDRGAVPGACTLWRDDASLRSTWHVYHLIGDVMRSEDLASDAARDADFLAALRARLAAEPIVLAPLPAAPAVSTPTAAVARRSARSWMTPAAVAAGFGAVAVVLVMTRGAGAPPASVPPLLAQSVPAQVVPAPAVATVAVPAPLVETVAKESDAEPPVLQANVELIRNAQLDRYLAAHKQFAGTSVLGVPSAFLRSATADASNR